MKIRSFAVGTFVVCALVVAGSLLAQDSRRPPAGLPEGFRGDHLLVESRDDTFTLLKEPQLRLIGDQTYLAGRSVHVEGLDDDELFTPTTRLIPLDRVRRMGEIRTNADLDEVRKLALKRRETIGAKVVAGGR